MWKSGVSGEGLKEAMSINKSLTALGDVEHRVAGLDAGADAKAAQSTSSSYVTT